MYYELFSGLEITVPKSGYVAVTFGIELQVKEGINLLIGLCGTPCLAHQ